VGFDGVEQFQWAWRDEDHVMASNQPVPNAVVAPAAVMPAPTALKDSPAVERALNRSKIYLLISWSLLYPEDEEFLDYLRSGEFVEDGRAALDTLKAMLDGQGGERAAQKLDALKKHVDLAEALIASECSNWQLSDLQSEHRRVFSNVITLDCPPYETLFGNDHVQGVRRGTLQRHSRAVGPSQRRIRVHAFSYL